MSFAEVTGISKTMLGQIERCESLPPLQQCGKSPMA